MYTKFKTQLFCYAHRETMVSKLYSSRYTLKI